MPRGEFTILGGTQNSSRTGAAAQARGQSAGGIAFENAARIGVDVTEPGTDCKNAKKTLLAHSGNPLFRLVQIGRKKGRGSENR